MSSDPKFPPDTRSEGVRWAIGVVFALANKRDEEIGAPLLTSEELLALGYLSGVASLAAELEDGGRLGPLGSESEGP